jgi:capsular polysaccharide biosynthesis protein
MYHALQKHIKLIIVWGIIFAIISAGVSFLFPVQYSADSQVLIISRDRTGVDPYTQAKSAQQIGGNLAQVMKTKDFYDKVMAAASYNFNRAAWQNLDDRQQRKKWAKDVQASMVYGTGIMNIKVYSYNQDEVTNLSSVITQTIASQGWEYLGGDVAIKVVSSPLVSRFPARPNYFLNGGIGFLIGILIAGLWVVRYKRHLFGNK